VRDYIKEFVYNNQINFDKAKDIFTNVRQNKLSSSLFNDIKNITILTVEKINTSKQAKPVSRLLDTKNASYTSFRASNTIPNKNPRITTSKKSLKNDSYNKNNEGTLK
jgi:hypothetical protein